MWDKSADSLEFADGTYLKIGTGNDLQIYHNGSNSFIKDTGTGSLIMSSNQLSIQKSDNTEAVAVFNEDGDELYAGENLPNSILVDFSNSTSSDELVLLDATGGEVDYVAYDDDTGWPVGSDYRGYAVELKNPTYDNSDPSNVN